MIVVEVVIGAVLVVAVALMLYRIVRGPTILDRMIASDVLLTTVMIVLAAEMVVDGHTDTLPVLLVLAATASYGTIAVARSVAKHDAPGDDPDDGSAP